MGFTRRASIVGVIALAVAVGALFGLRQISGGTEGAVRLGISPYQDTAMPVVAETNGLFAKEGVKVQLDTIAWENIVPALASRGKAVDVAIGSINTFLPRATTVNAGTEDPVIFYAPLYVFKGAALMARSDSHLVPFKQLLVQRDGNRGAALHDLMLELKGKRIGIPSGTPYDQMFIEAASEGGAEAQRYGVRDVQLSDALPALLSGDLDVAAAGVTQQTEAARHGNYLLINTEDLGFAEIVGLMTTRSYAQSHSTELEALKRSWFEAIRLLNADPQKASTGVLQYLAQNASTKYTFDEYMKSLQAQEFPATKQAADRMFETPSGRFYWKRTWDVVNNYLVSTGKITTPIPYIYYGDKN